MSTIKNIGDYDNISYIANPNGFDITELFRKPITSGRAHVVVGNLMDSTSELELDDFLKTKSFNIRNIKQINNNKNFFLIFGPRDLNKIKILFFIKLNEEVAGEVAIHKKNIIEYNKGENNFNYEAVCNEKIIFNEDFNEDFNKENNHNKYKFLLRFFEIFYSIDATNLLFTIPYELREMKIRMHTKIDIFEEKNKDLYKDFLSIKECLNLPAKTDYPIPKKENLEILDKLAFITLYAFLLMLDVGEQHLDIIQPDDEKNIKGILYKLYSSDKNNFITTYKKDTSRVIVSYGGLNKKLAKNGKQIVMKKLEKVDENIQSYVKTTRAKELNNLKIIISQNGGFNYYNPTIFDGIDLDRECKEINKYLKDLMSDFFNTFLQINKLNFLTFFTEGDKKDKDFESFSPIISNIFTLRYSAKSTNCFINKYKDEYNLIQVIGHSNNYSKLSSSIDLYDDAYIYGATIDLYGNYKDTYTTFVICLDNSKFFESKINDNNLSRAIFEYTNAKQNGHEPKLKYSNLNEYSVYNKIQPYHLFLPDLIEKNSNFKIRDNQIISFQTSLYDALLDYKKMDGIRDLNYYGSTKNNIFASSMSDIKKSGIKK
jgi:hypothetical protein